MIIKGLIVLVAFSATVANATDDAYLKMLEGEAEGLELDQKGQLQEEMTRPRVRLKGKDSFGWDSSIDGDNLPHGLEREQFESILQENFYGTYLFFNKLNSADKQTVYYRYSKAESTDLENVRKNILELLKR